MTSSRQSPKMSALNAGVAFVPLFDSAPSAVKITSVVSFSQFHFEIVLRSSSSLKRSPSQNTPKLHERGILSEIFSPLALKIPLIPAPKLHDSKPLLRGSMSSASPRPGPSPSSPALTEAFFHKTSPVRASRK